MYHPVFGQDFHFLDLPMILKLLFVIFSAVLLTIFRRLQHISCLQNPKLQVPSTNLNRNEHTHRKLLTRKVLALHISFMYGLLQILYFSARVASELVTKNEDTQDNM